MESRAIVDFPVCLSPMISSLCPRPIGIKLSISFVPVNRGVVIVFLLIISIAGLSIGLLDATKLTIFLILIILLSLLVTSSSQFFKESLSPNFLKKKKKGLIYFGRIL